MEEYICQAFTNNSSMNDVAIREQIMRPYSTVSADLPSDSVGADFGVYAAAPAWVNIMYFAAFIFGAGFVLYLAGYSF